MKRAHPIELTAVSAIVLDLLSGFQRPSRRPPDRHRSVGGPTLLRSASEAVKHPLGAGNPVFSRTWDSIHELTWGPRRGANPPLIRRWFVRGVEFLTAGTRPCQPEEPLATAVRGGFRGGPFPLARRPDPSIRAEPIRLWCCPFTHHAPLPEGATTRQPALPARRAAHRPARPLRGAR